MNRYLVTGGAGFIGSNICRKLVQEGCFVRVVDNLLTGKKKNLDGILDKIEFIEADMGDINVARAATKDIDVVLHQGAVPSVPRSVADPATTHRHCVDATFTLLLAAKENKVKRFVYAASSSAYGDTPTLPKIESMPTNPLSPYAAAKLFGEYYCSVFSKVYGLKPRVTLFQCLRSLSGPTSQYAAAIPAFVTKILKNESPTVYGDGEQTRDFTYIDNVIHANLLAARAKSVSGQVVNIACGQRISVNQIIGLINQILGRNVQIKYQPTRAGDVKHSLASIDQAKAVIGYQPVVLFEEGLQKAIAWYRTNLV
jgi:UDP-glucose 4-epimerase